MKNPILRIVISGILAAIITTGVVVIASLMLGRKTYVQFSDGFFWAGLIFILIGALNSMGRLNQPYVPFSQAAIHLNNDDRFKIWAADTLHGHRLLIFLGTSGLLLFGMAGLMLLIGG